MIDAILDPLGYDFFVRALLAAVVVGTVCAVVGTFVVLRGIAFIGDAVAHASFPGVVAAYLLANPFYLGAAVAAVATALAIGYLPRSPPSRLKWLRYRWTRKPERCDCYASPRPMTWAQS